MSGLSPEQLARLGEAVRAGDPVRYYRLLAEYEGQDTSYAVTVNPRSGAEHSLSKDPERGFVGTALSADGSTVLGFNGGFEPGPGHDVVTVPYRGGRPTVLAKNAFEPDWSG